MPLSPARHMLWKCLQECYQAPDPFKHLEDCIARFDADGIATKAELVELQETGFKILTLIYGQRCRQAAHLLSRFDGFGGAQTIIVRFSGIQPRPLIQAKGGRRSACMITSALGFFMRCRPPAKMAGMQDKPPQRRFRWSLSDLFALITALACLSADAVNPFLGFGKYGAMVTVACWFAISVKRGRQPTIQNTAWVCVGLTMYYMAFVLLGRFMERGLS